MQRKANAAAAAIGHDPHDCSQPVACSSQGPPLFGHARKRIGMQLCKAMEMEKQRMHGKIRVVSIRQQPTDRWEHGGQHAGFGAFLPWTCGRHRVRLLLRFLLILRDFLIVERRLLRMQQIHDGTVSCTNKLKLLQKKKTRALWSGIVLALWSTLFPCMFGDCVGTMSNLFQGRHSCM